MATTDLRRLPSAASRYPRAVLGAARRNRPRGLPERELRVTGVDADPGALAAYAEICGNRLTDTLPLLHPHLLAFPLAMELMTARDFPFPLLGLVHVANRVTRRRPLHAAERFDVRVRAEGLRPHRRGTVFDVVSEVRAVRADGPVWWERSTYLHRGSGSTGPELPPDEPVFEEPRFDNAALVPAPAAIGRRYAAVSGDRNPIHLHPLAAKPFGFPRAIAHGMWTAARAYALLDTRLPGALDSGITFRKPLLLPGTAVLRTAADGPATHFALTGRDGARTHLSGAVRPR